MVDPTDIKSYRRFIQHIRVHIFLAGLNNELEQIRGDILWEDPIPDLREAYALVRRKSLRQQTMATEIDTVAMVALNHTNSNSHWRQSENRTGSWN